LRKEYEYDYDIIKKKYNIDHKDEIDRIYFDKNRKNECIEIIENGQVYVRCLVNLLDDMFINKKDRYNRKEYSEQFHKNINLQYPYEYKMYSNYSNSFNYSNSLNNQKN